MRFLPGLLAAVLLVGVMAGCIGPKDTAVYTISIQSDGDQASAIPWSTVRDSPVKSRITATLEQLGASAQSSDTFTVNEAEFNSFIDDLTTAYHTHFADELDLPVTIQHNATTWHIDLQADVR